jgi:hypothetical protein
VVAIDDHRRAGHSVLLPEDGFDRAHAARNVA